MGRKTNGESGLKYTFALFVALASLVAALDVAAYPGAARDEKMTANHSKTNPGLVGYTTSDSFAKVDDFYKKLGSQDVPHSRVLNEVVTMVTLRFPGKKCQVSLSRSPAKNITVIQIFPRP